jgi:hypothetical protein
MINHRKRLVEGKDAEQQKGAGSEACAMPIGQLGRN